MANPDIFRENVLKQYEKLEPGEADTWNPLYNDFDLGYRLSHMYTLTKCMRIVDPNLKDLKVLDIGCGNGRSSRMYISLGLSPEQITGIDLRKGTIALASKLNPAINFETYDGRQINYPDNSFDWIQVAAVFSSLFPAHREFLAQEITRVLKPGGHMYYLGLWFAHSNRGHDVIKPHKIFSDLEILYNSPIRSRQAFPFLHQWWKFYNQPTAGERISKFLRLKNRVRNTLFPTHRVTLGRKPM